MDVFVQWLLDHWLGEMSVIAGAPGAFFVVMIVAWVTAYLVIKHNFADRIESHETRATTLQAHIDQKSGLLDEYRQRLDGATPLEVQTKIAALETAVGRLTSRLEMPPSTSAQGL